MRSLLCEHTTELGRVYPLNAFVVVRRLTSEHAPQNETRRLLLENGFLYRRRSRNPSQTVEDTHGVQRPPASAQPCLAFSATNCCLWIQRHLPP